jgi:hypothetical protein
MKPGQGIRSLIQSVYPGREELIDRGLSEYPAFRELCEDYRRCLITLENLRQPGATEHPERVREYEELLAQLARELEGSLEGLLQRQA